MARVKLENAHAMHIKELELENLKILLDKERAIEHANFIQAQADIKLQAH